MPQSVKICLDLLSDTLEEYLYIFVVHVNTLVIIFINKMEVMSSVQIIKM